MYLVTAASHVTHFCHQVTWTLTKGLEDLIRNQGFIVYKNRRSKHTSVAVHSALVMITQRRKEDSPEEVTDPTQGQWEAAGRRSEPVRREWPGERCPDMHTP